MDRPFAIMLGVSLVGHAVVFSAQNMTLRWPHPSALDQAAKVIYDSRPEPEHDRARMNDRYRVHAQLTPLNQGGGAPIGGGAAEGRGPDEMFRETAAHLLASAMTLAAPSRQGAWATAIDLTNLERAAQGNPVRLSYFSSVREQIQRTANRRDWFSRGTINEGTVYVGVVISREGRVQSTAVLADRSVPEPQLQDAALQILQAAGPFPEFPPSFSEPSLSLVVPLEFLLSSTP